ncbi:MAG: zinc metalloprotease HtpX [Candidatus Zixiibacteriota bacterium]
MNGLKVTAMMLVLMLVFMTVGYLVGGQNGMILAFTLACAMNFFSYWFSDKMILRMYKAREVKESDHPRLYRVVKRVATLAMIEIPRVYIVPSKAPNAFATGRDMEHSAVAVTEGLLEILDEDELEGVIGHEMAHILNKDMLIGAIAATFAGAIGILSSLARWGALFGGYGGREGNRGGGIGLLIAAIVAPLVAIIIQTAISRQREYKADEISGRMTGKFLPLASALQKLHRAPVRFNLDNSPATAHLMIANSLSRRGFTALFSTHPPHEKRIERLEKMATESVYQGYAV